MSRRRAIDRSICWTPTKTISHLLKFSSKYYFRVLPYSNLFNFFTVKSWTFHHCVFPYLWGSIGYRLKTHFWGLLFNCSFSAGLSIWPPRPISSWFHAKHARFLSSACWLLSDRLLFPAWRSVRSCAAWPRVRRFNFTVCLRGGGCTYAFGVFLEGAFGLFEKAVVLVSFELHDGEVVPGPASQLQLALSKLAQLHQAS